MGFLTSPNEINHTFGYDNVTTTMNTKRQTITFEKLRFNILFLLIKSKKFFVRRVLK